MAARSLCLFVEREGARAGSRSLATLVDLALGIVLWANYDIGGAQWQFIEHAPIVRRLHLGAGHRRHRADADHAHRVPDADLHRARAGSRSTKRVREYMAAFLLMETLMIGVFAAQDLFLFYIFFEAGLIPMYLIIGIWGGARAGSTPATSSSSTRCSARC